MTIRKREGKGRVWGIAVAIGLAALVSCSKRQDSSPGRGSDSTGAFAAPAAPAAPKSNGAVAPGAGVPAVGARHTVLFVGTSITAGLGLEPDSAYPMLIQRKIDSAGLPFDVVNAGVSGETSSGLLDRLDWLLRGTFDVMLLETGANDGLRGISPATVRANLDAALSRIREKRPDVSVVLVQMEALPNLGPKYASDFHAIFPSVAKARDVTLLPFLLANVAGHRELNQGDGVHPNDEGERIVANNVWAGLRPILDSVARATPSP